MMNKSAQSTHRDRSLRSRELFIGSIWALLVFLLPLIGGLLAGTPVSHWLSLPPEYGHVQHEGFSTVIFTTLSCFGLAVTGSWLYLARINSSVIPSEPPVTNQFPFMWYIGLALLAIGWTLSWARHPILLELQNTSFFILWLGYILAANALCGARYETSPISQYPKRYIALFPVSAAFWWMFEWLNRSVENWIYPLGETFTPFKYFILASLSFSTVLPAILVTKELVQRSGLFRRFVTLPWAIHFVNKNVFAYSCFVLGGIPLVLIHLYPNSLYMLLWVSPLLLLTALQSLWGRETVFSELNQKHSRSFLSWALSALICGGFWETWNYAAKLKWHYSIPYVDTWHIFEMPLLGYLGYLPFGLLCAAVINLVLGNSRNK